MCTGSLFYVPKGRNDPIHKMGTGGNEEGKAGWKEDGRKKSGREGRNKSPCVCILNRFHTSFTF
jgi:hypothetical protein